MKMKLSIYTKAALVLIAVGAAAVAIEYFFQPDDYLLFFYLTPVYCGILAAGLLLIAFCRKWNRSISPYLVFGLADGVIGLAVTAYAVYDIMTDTGWFAGLLGTLLLLLVVPATVVFLIVDVFLWWRNKRKKKAGGNVI